MPKVKNGSVKITDKLRSKLTRYNQLKHKLNQLEIEIKQTEDSITSADYIFHIANNYDKLKGYSLNIIDGNYQFNFDVSNKLIDKFQIILMNDKAIIFYSTINGINTFNEYDYTNVNFLNDIDDIIKLISV